jgi:hypothetical protein
MKMMRLFIAISCLLGLVASGFAQNVHSKTTPGILGFLDPKTGAFRVLPNPDADDSDASPPAATTGKFVFSFTITVSSSISASAKIGCSATTTLIDVSTSNFFEEEAAVLATRSGSTATCTVTIPYSWNLKSASSDKVTLAYSIDAPVEATATTALPMRLSSQTIGTIAVPAPGATTTETIVATI